MGKRMIGIILLVCLLSGCASEGFRVNTGQDNKDFVMGEDHQQYWNYFGATSTARFTRASEGYYYYDGANMLIRYYDLASERSVPLCNQPDCKHDDEGCDAYVNEYEYKINYLQFYDGYLYAIGSRKDSTKDVCVYRISADGSTRENIGTVFTLEGNATYRFLAHRGYAYFALRSGGTMRIYRFCLSGDSTAEIIFSTESRAGGEMALAAYGNYLYIHDSYLTGDGYTGELKRYHIHNGQVESVCEDIWRVFKVSETTLYYDNGTQLIARDLESGTESVLIETGMPVYMTFNGRYLCYDNWCGLWLAEEDRSKRRITIFDCEAAREVAVVPLEEEHSELVGMDGDNLIVMIPRKDGNGYRDTYVYCGIEDLVAGKVQWKAFDGEE